MLSSGHSTSSRWVRMKRRPSTSTTRVLTGTSRGPPPRGGAAAGRRRLAPGGALGAGRSGLQAGLQRLHEVDDLGGRLAAGRRRRDRAALHLALDGGQQGVAIAVLVLVGLP